MQKINKQLSKFQTLVAIFIILQIQSIPKVWASERNYEAGLTVEQMFQDLEKATSYYIDRTMDTVFPYESYDDFIQQVRSSTDEMRMNQLTEQNKMQCELGQAVTTSLFKKIEQALDEGKSDLQLGKRSRIGFFLRKLSSNLEWVMQGLPVDQGRNFGTWQQNLNDLYFETQAVIDLEIRLFYLSKQCKNNSGYLKVLCEQFLDKQFARLAQCYGAKPSERKEEIWLTDR